jgi:hypothetical protein
MSDWRRADTQIYIEVGFGGWLGMPVIPTFALRLPPTEVQGALQGVLFLFFSLPSVQILAWRRVLSTYSFGSSYACLRRVLPLRESR